MNVALVGCGRISKKHVAAIEAHPDLELYATCDIDIERAEQYDMRYYYGTFEIMLKERPNIDIVSICTPSDLHADMAKKAARAKKHVLIEKPIALDSFEAKRVIQICKENNVKLCVVVQNRFNLAMRTLKEKISSGDFGKILIANTTVRWYRPPEYFKGTWQGEFNRGGGVIFNQAMHHLDALLWLVGDIHSVSAKLKYFKGMDVPDACVAAIQFESGAIGTLEASNVTFPSNVESSVTIICEYGTFKVGGHALNRFVIYHTMSKDLETVELVDDVYGSGHIAQYAEFVNAIKDDRQPTTSGWEALNAVLFAEVIHSADMNGGWI